MNNTVITISACANHHQIKAAFDAATTLLIFDQAVTIVLLADAEPHRIKDCASIAAPLAEQLLIHWKDGVVISNAWEYDDKNSTPTHIHTTLATASAILNF